ncbi:hypothetical protein IBX73_06025 [candidate division WOR-3 bacterium]|nr:hypothetical protein [candidate division WOR-3 bacterium]
MKVFSILIVLCITVSSMWSYPWPIRDFQGPHQINATLGDYRQGITGNPLYPRFHNGVDIQASESTKVYSIVSDTVRYVTDGVRVGDYAYVHLMDRYPEGQYIEGIIDSTAPLDSVGITDNQDHVHFMEGAAGGPYQNSLRNGGLDNYTDNNNPAIIATPQFFPQGEELTSNRNPLHTDTLYGKVDIRVHMRDFANTGQGSGIYTCSYAIADTLDSIYYNSGTTIIFDQVSPPSNGTPVVYVYDTTVTEHANSATFHYWATNRIGNNQVEDRYWNTKQKADSAGIPFPDSVDADSIENDRFPDGYYWVKVMAYDIRDNFAAESVKVHVDNFNPKIKETRPSDWFAFVPTKEKRIWCRFSEAIDTTTLTATNIKIQSLRADSLNYTITNLVYDDSIHKLTLEVDSFRFKDTVQVRLLDGVRATGLWGQLVKSMSGYVQWFVTCAQVGTDGQCAIIAHRVLPDVIMATPDRMQSNCAKMAQFSFHDCIGFFEKAQNPDIFVLA